VAWSDDIMVQVLGEFVDASTISNRSAEEHVLAYLVQRREVARKYYDSHREEIAVYIETHLEQRREAVRRYRDNHREEYRARDRARWQRRQELRRANMREELPSERSGPTQRFTIVARNFNTDGSLGEGVQEFKGYITANVYPALRDDGTSCPLAGQLGEVFVKMGKPGSKEALLDQFAISFSRELQRGTDLKRLCRKHRRTQFEPSGAVLGIKGITKCTSIIDLLCHYLELRFSDGD